MRRILHDYFWVFIVASVILFGAITYFMPKLTKFPERFLDGRQSRREKKNEPEEKRRENSMMRCGRRRRNENSEVNKFRNASNRGSRARGNGRRLRARARFFRPQTTKS